MKDVIVPQNDIVRRPSTVPEPYVASLPKEEWSRIEKNPFFEKPQNKGVGLERKKESSPHGILWALLFAFILAGGFTSANYYAKATVEIAPIVRSVAIDTDISALKEASGDELIFQFMSLSEEKVKEVPATIEKKIQKKASGKVTIFNKYNGEKQRLIKNTRLEDSKTHKIFRIDESVVVPGATMVGGKVTTPGSVEALVYADGAGPEYNIGTTNFTIPGFKGDPRYTRFSATSKPDFPIGGGFSGTIKVPSDEVVENAQSELEKELLEIAVIKVRAQIPSNATFFPGSMAVKFEEVPQDFTAVDTAKVSMRAMVSVFFFDTEKLTEKLAQAALTEYKNNSFMISNMSELKFSFIDPVEKVVLSDLSNIHFHISSTAEFVGQVDTQKIRTLLAGKNKKDFSKIIIDQSNISKANAVVRPMWKTVFPSDHAKITVKILGK